MGMPTRRKGPRVLGPYPNRAGFRCITVEADGHRAPSKTVPTYEDAEELKAYLEAEISTRQLNTDTARTLYLDYLRDVKGDAKGTRDTAEYALKSFFPDPMPLWGMRPKYCQARYDELTGRLATDTHRNYLGQAKTFLDWCVAEKLMSSNPAKGVKGVGRRKKGKPQLRIKQARAWYRKTLELAGEGDTGAIAALVALLLGLRASEICRMQVGDLDEDELPGDTLWIDKSKTPKGERTLAVPESLRPHLVELAEGKKAEDWIFPARRGRPHDRGWVRAQAKRIGRLAKLPAPIAKSLTAHGLRGMLASISLRRGAPGELVADTLGHEDQRTTREAYAEEGAAEAGDRRRGLKVIEGGRRG